MQELLRVPAGMLDKRLALKLESVAFAHGVDVSEIALLEDGGRVTDAKVFYDEENEASYESLSPISGTVSDIDFIGRCLILYVDGMKKILIQGKIETDTFNFSLFGGKCNATDSDDDALDLALEFLPLGGTLSLAGMPYQPKRGMVLTRNHLIRRGNLTIDWAGMNVYWRAPSGYTPDRTDKYVSNPRFPGHLAFRGVLSDEVYTQELTQPLPAGSEQYPVPGVSGFFEKGSWWLVTTDVSPGTTVGKEINYIIESQGDYGNANQVRLNYKTAWDLEAGRTISYRRCYPVENIKMLNMANWYYEQPITDGTGTGDAFSSNQATSILSFEIANDYLVEGLVAEDIPYAAIVEQWVSRGIQRKCGVNNPSENRSDQIVGRNGSIYCKAENLFNMSGRHVIDHTSSAYCVVSDSHETGSKNGAFTHHGSFEHDIYYENTSGVLSIANSGPEYGESARNITARNHRGTELIAGRKVSDCYFENCVFSKYAKVNADGFVFINTDIPKSDPSLLGGLMFTQASQRSGKGVMFIGGKVELSISVDAIPTEVVEEISFEGTRITDFRARKLMGQGRLVFKDCIADGGVRGHNTVYQKHLIIRGGEFTGVPFRFDGPGDQTVNVGGGYRHIGQGSFGNNAVWDLDKDISGVLDFNMTDAYLEAPDIHVFFIRCHRSGSSKLRAKISNVIFSKGRVRFQPGLASDEFFKHSDVIMLGTSKEWENPPGSIPDNNNFRTYENHMYI